MAMPATVVEPTRTARLRAAARDGAPWSMFRLATALAASGNAAAEEEARALHRRAARAGHVGAQVAYGRMQLQGIGGESDPQHGVDWLMAAERLAHPVAGYWLAWAALGSVLLPRTARINQRILAAMQYGYTPALVAAAVHLGRRPDPGDQALCVRMLECATARGNAVAALLLSERLQHGEGCQPEPRLAAAVRARLRGQGVDPLPLSVALPVPPDAAGAAPATLAFEEALAPSRAVLLAPRPRLSKIDALLSTDECRLLMAAALVRTRRAASTTATLRLDIANEDLALRIVQLRLARAAHAELAHAEQIQIQRRGPGAGDGITAAGSRHFDSLQPDVLARDHPEAGNRVRTLHVCLRPADGGGGMVFPQAGMGTTPRAGCAVMFDTLHADGSHDSDALHADLPVRSGEQWQATLWLREGRYRQA
ncbi:hypothetical protein SAMN02745674_01999 [Lysobacter spongiicola DSM 21749]|uniref:Fe2OG dioxygenase domain-containing protein n=2 Tax=Novilysobacter TaxID=3382699 RepID=A0A1T4R6G5_9GAMM|nr:hypothetical protein SAMN02745674_01999 [Lysobacter spongiicola DSM 21749]